MLLFCCACIKQLFGDAISASGDLTDAVQAFSDQRAGEAKALVRISRELDRPGKLGVLTFILPLILDSIFNKIAPKIFAPNTIAMLQKEGVTFRQVARRKRFDRIGQVAVIGAFLTGVVAGARAAVNGLAGALGKNNTTVIGAFTVGCVAAFFVKKLAGYLVPGMAPADVLNKTKSKVTDSSKQEIKYTEKEDFMIPSLRKKKEDS